MTRLVLSAATILMICAAPAVAKDPGQGVYMVRVMACEGPDASMEIYLPQSIALSPDAKVRAMDRPVIGYYTLDLTAALKGKMLEPARVSFSADKKTLIVDQYTRGLPPTRIPVAGGTVDFDKRFGTQAKCSAFSTQK
jgi:hypothetical protein